MEFQNKIAMVTGAAVGIGKAVALTLASEGADLILLDVNLAPLQAVAEEIRAMGRKALVYECDVSQEERVYAVTQEALATFGKIDILINNAALWRDQISFAEASTDLWRRYLDINVMGVVYCTKAVLDSMLAQQYGRIVNVASVAGVYGNGKMAHYSATKGAVIAMTKALAKEVAEQGIRINCVSPGTVTSSKHDDMDLTSPTELSYMKRTGSDRENAELICFLASDRANYIHGQNIQIDGCRQKQ